MYASEGGSKEAVLSLVGAGADVNWECQTFGSPLHVAASRGNVGICEVLIRAGAQVNLQDWHSGATPLMHAAQRGRQSVIEMLISVGAHAQLADKCGRTALHHAAMLGWSAVVQSLLISTALSDTNTPDFSGNTPLLLAVFRRRYSCVFKLVQYGADLNRRGKPSSDCDPVSAIELALTLNDRDMLEILSLCFADKRIVPWHHQHTLHPTGFCEHIFPVAPRKLKELCRVQVRLQLNSCTCMLMINKLPLPAELQDYLWLKDLEEDYSRVWPEDGPLSTASSQSSLFTN
jgi:ankyrin repeat protein